jgi:phage gp36-like protein
MTYAAKQDMIDRFGEPELIAATNKAEMSTFLVVDGVLNQALEDADSQIDTYLAARYSLPLTDIPTILKKVACDIARYNLYGNVMPDEVKDRYDRAVAWLKSVAKGEAVLVTDDPADSPDAAGGADFEADDRVFDSDTLDDY